MNSFIFNSKILLITIVITPIIYLLSIGLANILKENKDSYFSVFSDDIIRLEKIDSKSFILIGGSNTAFSVSARYLSKKSGYHFLNLGRHASIDIVDYIKLIRKKTDQLNLNTQLIVIPEFYSYKKKNVKSSINCWKYPYWKYLDINWYLCFPEFIKNFIKLRILNNLQSDLEFYTARNFDEFGDYNYAENFPKKNIAHDTPGYLGNIDYYKNSNLLRKLKKIDKSIIILPPVIPNYHCKNSNFSPNDFLKLLAITNNLNMNKNNLSICIGDKFFLDTSYHTNREYRKKRSNEIYNFLSNNFII